MTITNFPKDVSAKYLEHTADPVQNLLAPFVREATVNHEGANFRFEYISILDAYALLKRVMPRAEPSSSGEPKEEKK
jgi:hypothetical protein